MFNHHDREEDEQTAAQPAERSSGAHDGQKSDIGLLTGECDALRRDLDAADKEILGLIAGRKALRAAVEAMQQTADPKMKGPGTALRGGWILAIKAVLELLDEKPEKTTKPADTPV